MSASTTETDRPNAQSDTQTSNVTAPDIGTPSNTSSDMSNVLKHIKELEQNNRLLTKKLSDLRERNSRLSQKTREGMQSALDTLMKKWMDSCETKDENVKEKFKTGLEQLVKNSAEENGVWQMMVSASALHERQVHDLEQLRGENTDLRTRVNGLYGHESSRIMGEKRKPDTDMSSESVEAELPPSDIWGAFLREIGSTHF